MLTRASQPQFVRDIRQDIRIWHHKTYLERPRLAEGDGPITAWRRWTSQFYSPAQSRIHDCPTAATEPLCGPQANGLRLRPVSKCCVPAAAFGM
ncbi:hypothetical protein [Streptomyces sp. MspMP-M5]